MENSRAYLLRTEITKSHLNNHICQHCGVKTSTVTPSFYYVFNISLSCKINIPSFIGNLWWDLLLENHLKAFRIQDFIGWFGYLGGKSMVYGMFNQNRFPHREIEIKIRIKEKWDIFRPIINGIMEYSDLPP